MTDKFAWHAELVKAMSHVAGVDLARRVVEGTLIPDDLTDVVTTCTRCGKTADCQTFLGGCGAETPLPPGGGAVPEYCLNHTLFTLLSAE